MNKVNKYPPPIDRNDPLNIGYIYIIGVRMSNAHSDFKVGRTVNLRNRFHSLKQMYRVPLYILHYVRIEHHVDIETGLHRIMKQYHIPLLGREWFQIPPGVLTATIDYLDACSMPDNEYEVYLRNKEAGFTSPPTPEGVACLKSPIC